MGKKKLIFLFVCHMRARWKIGSWLFENIFRLPNTAIATFKNRSSTVQRFGSGSLL